MPALEVYLVKPFSRGVDARVPDVPGVTKSGSPTPREMASFISSRISKELRMPRASPLDAPLAEYFVVIHEKIHSLSCCFLLFKDQVLLLYFGG